MATQISSHWFLVGGSSDIPRAYGQTIHLSFRSELRQLCLSDGQWRIYTIAPRSGDQMSLRVVLKLTVSVTPFVVRADARWRGAALAIAACRTGSRGDLCLFARLTSGRCSH